MTRKAFIVVACCLFGVLGAFAVAAQETAYRRVGSHELLDGYVKDGERIETKAHVWCEARGVFLNFNRASARYPFQIEFAGADPTAVARLARECQAETQFHGGCEVTMRGAPSRAGGKRILFVSEIVAIEPGR